MSSNDDDEIIPLCELDGDSVAHASVDSYSSNSKRQRKIKQTKNEASLSLSSSPESSCFLRRWMTLIGPLIALAVVGVILHLKEERQTKIQDVVPKYHTHLPSKSSIDAPWDQRQKSSSETSQSFYPNEKTDTSSSSESTPTVTVTSSSNVEYMALRAFDDVSGIDLMEDVCADEQKRFKSKNKLIQQAVKIIDENETWPVPPHYPEIDYDSPVPFLIPDSEHQTSQDYYSIDNIVKRFEDAKTKYWNKLRLDYGCDNFNKMFFREDTPIGRLAMGQPMDTSWKRMIRKFLIKILRLQIMINENSSISQDARKLAFVWATGGHSACAAHGNLHRESYTATLERALREPFAALGLHFVGRNFAGGGLSSGPEVGFCIESIFGMDIDVLSWDYGMTDGRNDIKMDLYFRRAGLHPNRPAVVGINVGDGKKAPGNVPRIKKIQNLSDMGLTATYLRWTEVIKTIDAVPSSLNKTTDDLLSMPPLVRNFKCGNVLEKGEPFCGHQKYNKEVCENRKFKTSWHPGWKHHAMEGNILALSLMEMLGDALKQLQSDPPSDPSAMLADLLHREDADYDRFFRSNTVEDFDSIVRDDFDFEWILQNRGICHTGLIPSQIRYKGILSETTSNIGYHDYEKAISFEDASSTPNDGELMRLTYEDLRQECSVALNIDYKDYFSLHPHEGWKKMLIPNRAAIKEYRVPNQTPLKGLVGFALGSCSWGKCKEPDAREADFLDFVSMTVNGVSVTNTTLFQGSAVFLQHSDGHYFAPNQDGQFEIRAKVAEGKYARFLAFFVW